MAASSEFNFDVLNMFSPSEPDFTQREIMISDAVALTPVYTN